MKTPATLVSIGDLKTSPTGRLEWAGAVALRTVGDGHSKVGAARCREARVVRARYVTLV